MTSRRREKYYRYDHFQRHASKIREAQSRRQQLRRRDARGEYRETMAWLLESTYRCRYRSIMSAAPLTSTCDSPSARRRKSLGLHRRVGYGRRVMSIAGRKTSMRINRKMMGEQKSPRSLGLFIIVCLSWVETSLRHAISEAR